MRFFTCFILGVDVSYIFGLDDYPDMYATFFMLDFWFSINILLEGQMDKASSDSVNSTTIFIHI